MVDLQPAVSEPIEPPLPLRSRSPRIHEALGSVCTTMRATLRHVQARLKADQDEMMLPTRCTSLRCHAWRGHLPEWARKKVGKKMKKIENFITRSYLACHPLGQALKEARHIALQWQVQ